METQYTQQPSNNYQTDVVINTPASGSAVSWCAVFAGAVASAALSLVLLFLGTGLGFTLVSPWSHEGISATAFSVTSIVGVTVISLLASALGGYLAGRLRTRWVDVARDEVHFRDTAHGFLAWGVATLGTAALLTTAIGGVIGGGIKAGTAVASGAHNVASLAVHSTTNDGPGMNNSPLPYLLDSLLRQDASGSQPSVTGRTNMPADAMSPATPESQTEGIASSQPAARESRMQHRNPSARGELMRIYLNGISAGALPEEDIRYAGSLVAQTTGVDQQTAEARVADTFSRLQSRLQHAETTAKEAADKARKVSASVSLWFFISLLAGAFIASLMAVYGGRQRDL
jgi:hypothetical protein